MTEAKKWNIVYTRPRSEKKVAERLVANRIEVFCPFNTVSKQWVDRKKIILEPLFDSYVFVRISDKELPLVKKINGIVNLVYWLGKPAVIRDEEIEMIKDFLNQCKHVRLEKNRVDANTNDKIKILHSPVISQHGDVVEVQAKSVIAYLPSLGYQLVADIEKSNTEIIRELESKYGLAS